MKAWLDKLDPMLRERLLLGGGLLILLLLFVLVWFPLEDARSALRGRVEQQQETLRYLQTAAPRLRRDAPGANPSATGQERSLLALVDASVRAEGLGNALNRAEPEGTDQVRVWLDNAAFDATVAWIENLYRSYGVQVRELSVDRAGGPGLVNVRVVLDAS